MDNVRSFVKPKLKQEGADAAWREVECPSKDARPARFGKPRTTTDEVEQLLGECGMSRDELKAWRPKGGA